MNVFVVYVCFRACLPTYKAMCYDFGMSLYVLHQHITVGAIGRADVK